MYPVIEVDTDRRWSDDRGGARRGRVRASGRHRAARACRRLLRHVRRLRARAATRSPPPLALGSTAERAAMTRRRAEPAARPRWRRTRPAGRRFLDRPYASVQLLLLAGGGLLGFGLMMAVSTTIAAVAPGRQHRADVAQVDQGDRVRRVGHAGLLARGAAAAARLPAADLPRCSISRRRPGRGAGPRHRRRRQRRAPLDRPRPAAAAAVRVRQARVLLWGADLLARKQQLGTLRRARHLFVPLVPGVRARLRCWSCSSPTSAPRCASC